MHMIGYVKATINYGITYSRECQLKLSGFMNFDYEGCHDTKQSTSGYVFTMASRPVAYSSKQQATIALLTIEAEFVSLTHAAQQMK